jgi:hypothetical protein
MKNNNLCRRQLCIGVELYQGWIVPACDRSQIDPGQNSLRKLERNLDAGHIVHRHHCPENRGELQHACLDSWSLGMGTSVAPKSALPEDTMSMPSLDPEGM